MAIEFKDGTWGKTKPLSDAWEDLQRVKNLWEVRALHVGTEEEIEERKEETATEMRLKGLEDRIKMLEVDRDGLIHIPNALEVKDITGE